MSPVSTVPTVTPATGSEVSEESKVVSVRLDPAELASLELVRSWLVERTCGALRLSDSDVVRWCVRRAAAGVYLELTGTVNEPPPGPAGAPEPGQSV